tara:strand:+ start:839 stop:1141 length:303 start_codon:yes stop_codon:yes gene_type:complete
MGLLTPLLLLHLLHQLHQLFHGEQNAAAVDQIIDRRMEILAGRLGKPTEAGGVNLPEKIEQGLTCGSSQQLTQHLQIKRLLPIEGDGPKPAQPLKACQLF